MFAHKVVVVCDAFNSEYNLQVYPLLGICKSRHFMM